MRSHSFSNSRLLISESSQLSSAQLHLDAGVQATSEEISHWQSLTAMSLGGLSYRLSNLALRQVLPGLGRYLAPIFSLGAEVTTYELSQRSLLTLSNHSSNPNLLRWSGTGGIWEGLRDSYVNFGFLKLGGMFHSQNLFFQHLTQDLFMVAGHEATAQLGWVEHDNKSFAEKLFNAERTNLQLGAAMGVLHRVLPSLRVFERNIERQRALRISPSENMRVNSVLSFNGETLKATMERGTPEISASSSEAKVLNTQKFLENTLKNIKEYPDSDVLTDVQNERYINTVREALSKGITRGVTAALTDILLESFVAELRRAHFILTEMSVEDLLDELGSQIAPGDVFARRRWQKVKDFVRGKNYIAYRYMGDTQPDHSSNTYRVAFMNLCVLDTLPFFLQGKQAFTTQGSFHLLPAELLEFLEEAEGTQRGVPVVSYFTQAQVINFANDNDWPLLLCRHRAEVHGYMQHPWVARFHDGYHTTKRNTLPYHELKIRDHVSFVLSQHLQPFIHTLPVWARDNVEFDIAKLYEGKEVESVSILISKIYETLKRVNSSFADTWLENVLADCSVLNLGLRLGLS